MPLTIRPVQKSELETVTQVGMAAWISSIAPLLETISPSELLLMEEAFRGLLFAHLNAEKTAPASLSASSLSLVQSGADREKADDCVKAKGEPSFLFCADLGGQITGFYVLDLPVGQPADLTDLWVSPQWQGQGVASPLIRDVIDKSKQYGHSSIQLQVLAANQRALAFYHKNGFCEYRRQATYNPFLKCSLETVEMRFQF
ncbi:MAG: GNAT family N-acetyltransferase [Cohaesibacter sp.]|jgi:ribosomal-protein-alanine N-acetyltransferase|nr:GNAT family N-acetyltransferase [Cohaesibacter sp.]